MATTYTIDSHTADTIAYGSIHTFKGVAPADQDQLVADMRAAAGHAQFVVVFLNAKGAATVTGDAAMHEAMVATLSDQVVDDLAARAQAVVVETAQPILAQLQAAQGA